MNLGQLLLGAVAIFGGVTSVSRGLGHVNRALKAPPARRLPSNNALRDLPVTHRGTHKQTVSGPIRTTRKTVNNLDDRIKQIRSLAHEGKFDPEVIAAVRKELTAKCRPGWNGQQWCVPEKNRQAEIAAIYKMLRTNVRYTSDIHGADTYAHPRVTLRLGSGDCDDFSSLGCAALMSAGIQCRLKVIQTKNSRTPDHIYFEALDGDRWIPMDASVAAKSGWEAPKSMVTKTWTFPV